MKVVLFCGGLGSRLGSLSAQPKPLVRVGHRPLIWYLMRYYAHFGHREFILCTGYHARQMAAYFDTEYLLDGRDDDRGADVGSPGSGPNSWTIELVNSGEEATLGERLLSVRHLLAGEGCFLANYGDVLSDFPLPELIDRVQQGVAVCGLLSVPLAGSFHLLSRGENESLRVVGVANSGIRMNGGFFVCRGELLEHLVRGEELIDGAVARLGAEGRVVAHEYDGFWRTVDTPKDLLHLEQVRAQMDPAPWEVWRRVPS